MVTLADPIPRRRRRKARSAQGADIIQKVAMALALLLVGAAIFAPLLTAYDPLQQSLLARLRPPVGLSAIRRAISRAPTSWAATCSPGRCTGCG